VFPVQRILQNNGITLSPRNPQAIMDLYNATLGSVRVHCSLETDADALPEASAFFHAHDACLIATTLAQAISITYALGRSDMSATEWRRSSCNPHLCLTFTPPAKDASFKAPEDLYEAVTSGAALSTEEKASLITLSDAQTRLDWSLAWTILRCQRSFSARRAIVEASFYLHQEGLHANVFVITFLGDSVLIELFDPNGFIWRQADEESSFLKSLLSGLASRVSSLIQQEVRFTRVGHGLQSLVGAWLYNMNEEVYEFKGYSICAAVCVWLCRRFLKHSSWPMTLEAFEAEEYANMMRSPENHSYALRSIVKLMRQLLEYQASTGAALLQEHLSRYFENSNVLSCRVTRPGGYAVAYFSTTARTD